MNGPQGEDWVSADTARTWWKALMANACSLIDDADVLAGNRSFARARSLIVLSMEELAKAKWLYDAAVAEWNCPLGLWGQAVTPAGPVLVPEQLLTVRRPHAEKIEAAEQYAAELPGFWGQYTDDADFCFPSNLTAFDAAARQRNLDKQAGFYVDRRADDTFATPQAISQDGFSVLLRRAAQVLEMHLIEDHTRQQRATDPSAVDSSQDLHAEILPFAHPTEFGRVFGASPEYPADDSVHD